MAMLKDIEALFFGARAFGCSPHKIIGHEFIITKSGMIYSALLSVIFTYVFCYQTYFAVHDYTDPNMQLLVTVRSVLAYISFFVDRSITMFWNSRLTSALDLLHVYDTSAKFQTQANDSLRNCCRFSMVIVIIFWIIAGYMAYICEGTDPLATGIAYIFFHGGISFQILKFYGMMLLLYRRFYHLNQLVMPKEFIGPNFSLRVHAWQSVKLQDLWWMHCSLIMAAEEINNVYSAQLLLWISLMSLNGLSRIYTIVEGTLDEQYVEIRDGLNAIACLTHLFFITALCHLTSRQVHWMILQANSIPDGIFSARSVIQLNPSIVKENLDAAMYFSIQKLRFTAADGLIHIHLPLLLSIAGVMTTYLVILHKSPATGSAKV